MIAQKRDANEAVIVKTLRAAGFGWIPMDKSAGFDGLIVSRITGVHIVEIKNPATRWRMTPAEEKRQAQVEAEGGVYNIVFWPETALNLARGERVYQWRQPDASAIAGGGVAWGDSQ